MVNEEIFGGLASALYRGESLQRAMMTFYNAGYKKEEIEEAARALHSQRAGQPTTQQTTPIQPIPGTIAPSQKPIEKKTIKTQPQPRQKVSGYGPSLSQDTEELKKEIGTAIHHLKQIKIPSRIKIIEGREGPKPPVIIQKISDYAGAPPKPITKAVTLILVVLLILLLGALVAVFFFKEELIEIFNNFGM